jgi:hypothetical protein
VRLHHPVTNRHRFGRFIHRLFISLDLPNAAVSTECIMANSEVTVSDRLGTKSKKEAVPNLVTLVPVSLK